MNVRLALLLLTLTCCACECDRTPSPTSAPAPDVAPAPASAAPKAPAPLAIADPRLPGIEQPDEATERELRVALKARGPGHQPRTHHLDEAGQPKYVNRLIRASSPYLLQHAHNPVNWYPWGDEAFRRARQEGKPVLLSVGYSTCHWCHVMERESFEDEEIAAFLNQHFVAIKVDREERPDLDDVYMRAVQMLTGRGGWPMTVALTPDREPFFAGTYFPPRDGARGAHKGFLTILQELAARYRDDPAQVVAQARALSDRMARASSPQPAADLPTAQALQLAALQLARGFDERHGGFGAAPKFPEPSKLRLLLRYWRRTGDERARQIVSHTLEQMARGGIHDQVGGGFHRYSVDPRWQVPHFEKMLYDNAQLATLYLEAWQATADPRFAHVAERTLDYLAGEMRSPQGAFFSATDADSLTPEGHREEGYFFTWTPEEIDEALPEALRPIARAVYRPTEAGNFEGRTILSRREPLDDTARGLELSPQQLRQKLDAVHQHLYRARQERPAPLLDDKILASWNGLAISAFARAALALDRPDHAEVAARAADFVLREMRDEEGRLKRSWRMGQTSESAFLDDYAFLVQGLLDLHEATGQLRWLTEAQALQETLDEHYLDQRGGGYFTTAADHEALLTRDKPSHDGAEPGGNAIAAMNLLRLYQLTDHQPYRQRAEALFRAFGQPLSQGSPQMTATLAALDFYLDVPRQIVLVTPDAQASDDALLAQLRHRFVPNRVLIRTPQGAPLQKMQQLIPLLEDKRAIEGRTTAFVCEEGRCELPTSSPQEFARQIDVRRPLFEDHDPMPLP